MLLLASASPRRKELLGNAGIAFDVLPVGIDEKPLPGEAADPMARRLAEEKAQTAFDLAQRDPKFNEAKNGDRLIVLGADTVVAIDDQILGKPTDAADAARMLTLLSGRTHRVITGVALISEAGRQISSAVTSVAFSPISQTEIADYIASGEPMDKAGAYAIQGRASRWATEIVGCYFNVVGLPVSLVYQLLNNR